MTAFEGILCFTFLAMLLSAGWFLPRKLGIIGIFLAHVAISIITIAAIFTDFIRGVVPDPDFIWLIGNFCWVGLANIVLLPLTSYATFRHYIHRRKVVKGA